MLAGLGAILVRSPLFYLANLYYANGNMRLTPANDQDIPRLIVTGLLIIVIILSVFTAFWFGSNAQTGITASLRERSQTIAAALDAKEVGQLKGEESDAKTDVYKNLKSQLVAIKAVNPDVRSVYIMGKKDSQLFFYNDSEQPDSRDYSSPGQGYSDGTPEDHAIFDNGKAFVEGPIGDSYGTFVSGLAPIIDANTNTVIAIVGIDVDANTYLRDIVASAAIPTLVGMVIVLIIVVFERIRRHNQQLLALRSELVSVASHELRNPITGIRWAAESMPKITTDAQVLKIAKAILDSAQHLQASTDDILELSHATNGRALNMQPTDLTKLMGEIIETQALAAQQKGVTIDFDQYWPKTLSIQCDSDQMRRAMQNIVSNAIKYTRPNTVVTISYQQNLKLHKILISDKGIGIPAAEQSKVWRGFYRASNAVKSEVSGTGLGLYLVKTVIERHGGTVNFVSEENKGTTFIVDLPKSK